MVPFLAMMLAIASLTVGAIAAVFGYVGWPILLFGMSLMITIMMVGERIIDAIERSAKK